MPTRIAAASLFALFLVVSLQAQTEKRLWVLQAPDHLVEYDLVTFTPRRTISVPRLVPDHPQDLSVSAAGQLLLQPPPASKWMRVQVDVARGCGTGWVRGTCLSTIVVVRGDIAVDRVCQKQAQEHFHPRANRRGRIPAMNLCAS